MSSFFCGLSVGALEQRVAAMIYLQQKKPKQVLQGVLEKSFSVHHDCRAATISQSKEPSDLQQTLSLLLAAIVRKLSMVL